MGALEDTKREVLRATDIVSLIEQYVPLKRAGRSMTALCPFHQEKSPSFHVSSERQTFKCFGCGKGGNAIDFVIEREGVDFKTALRHLADKAGIRMPERGQGGPDDSGARERKRLFEINEQAAKFYRMALTASRTGEHAREYVRSRGIDEETEERFQIGWAPADWSRLLDFLGKRGYAPQEVEKAGLAIPRKSGGGYFDRYRNRLMFPIHDIMGRVVSFGGRALAKEDNPKYMNGPETPIFRKGELCYALHLAKDAARARGEVAVVEGYVDVVLAHQAGFPWMVATLGTAFRSEHAKILARIAPKLLVFFDGDAAGASANRRGLVEAGRAGVGKFKELRVALLPDGLDPADLVQQRGAAALDAAVKAAISITDFYVAAAGGNSAEKAAAIKEVCEILAAIDHDETYREVEIAATAHRFHIPEEMVRKAVKQAKEQAEARATKAGEGPARVQEDGPSYPSARPAPPRPEPPLPRLEGWLVEGLECLFAVPALLEDARAKGVRAEWVVDPRAQAILGALLAGRAIAEIDDASARALAAEIAAKIDTGKHYELSWRGVVARLTAERDERLAAHGTKGIQDELQETVARKLRREQLQRRVSLRGGELEDVNG